MGVVRNATPIIFYYERRHNMSVEYLNNNAVYSLVSEAYKQSVGEKAVATENLADFIDGGIAHDDLGKYREQFTKALILGSVKSVFLDSLYRRSKAYGFRTEDMQFKAIIQAITITAPEVQAAHNWKVFADGDSIGTYNIKLPTVDATLYGKTSSWELQYDLTGNQWDDAFTSEAEVEGFVGAIRLAIANALEAHDEELDDLLRNALIAECIKNDAKVTAHSISVVDLRKAYNAEMKPSSNITTAADFLANADCLKFMSRKLTEFKDYFKKMSKLFNIAQRATFVPEERIKLQILGYAEQAFNSVAQSGTFHEIFTSLPGYETVPYWQGSGLQDATSTALAFDQLSKISVTDENNVTTTADGIVALMADKWACLHGLKYPRRIATKYHEPEDVLQTFVQTVENRAVIPTQNAVVFILSTEPSVTVSPNQLTLKVGGTADLSAVTYPAAETVTWSASDSGTYASVNASTGKVTAVAEGDATITATITVGGVSYTDTCAVTVEAAAEE